MALKFQLFSPEVILLLIALVIVICYLRKYRKNENRTQRLLWAIAIVVIAALTVGANPTWYMRNKKLYK